MLTLETKKKIKRLDTITCDMWGKTGRITEIRKYTPNPPPERRFYPDDESFRRVMSDYQWHEDRRKKNHKDHYFLRFWVPNRCTGLWLTEEQMEDV